jgi:hypothetical protein
VGTRDIDRRGVVVMRTLGFESCEIQGRNSILVVDHDKKEVLSVLDATALSEWLETPKLPETLAGREALSGKDEGAETASGLLMPDKVWVDLVPNQIRALQEAYPEADIRVYGNAIPHQIGREELRRLEEEYGDTNRNLGAQRHMAAVKFAFDERQLSIGGGKLTLRFVTQDLHLHQDKIKRLNRLFDFCQHFLMPDPALREHVEDFLEGPDAESVPESATLIREYMDIICPEVDTAEQETSRPRMEVEEAEEDTAEQETARVEIPRCPLHLVKDTWLHQVERGDEEENVPYEEVVEKILALRWEEHL